MALSREQVHKVANLARLQLTEAESGKFADQLAGVLDYFRMLQEIDTTNVEPMVHAIELSNVFRDDELKPSLSRTDALANAPKSDGRSFLVPEILDAGESARSG
jgi:aspartyl-tRNA(Asn)/glutamyl-tRNA(Gln) amidotransferase subunit C